MRNRFPGTCYRCAGHVPAGEGHFERFDGGWRVQHSDCAIKFRGTPDPARQAAREHFDSFWAAKTGRKAQRARRRIREREGGAA